MSEALMGGSVTTTENPSPVNEMDPTTVAADPANTTDSSVGIDRPPDQSTPSSNSISNINSVRQMKFSDRFNLSFGVSYSRSHGPDPISSNDSQDDLDISFVCPSYARSCRIVQSHERSVGGHEATKRPHTNDSVIGDESDQSLKPTISSEEIDSVLRSSANETISRQSISNDSVPRDDTELILPQSGSGISVARVEVTSPPVVPKSVVHVEPSLAMNSTALAPARQNTTTGAPRRRISVVSTTPPSVHASTSTTSTTPKSVATTRASRIRSTTPKPANRWSPSRNIDREPKNFYFREENYSCFVEGNVRACVDPRSYVCVLWTRPPGWLRKVSALRRLLIYHLTLSERELFAKNYGIPTGCDNFTWYAVKKPVFE